MLRRMKESKGVNLGLPPKTEVILYLPLVPMQRFWYKRLLTRLDKGVLETVFKGAKEKAKVEDVITDEGLVKDEGLEGVDEGAEWVASKAIAELVTKEKSGTQWQKLMNLLMQLRKVLCLFSISPFWGGVRRLIAAVLFTSLSLT